MIQAGRPQVRFPMRSLDFSVDLILGTIQPLKEMSTRNLREGKKWAARKADNFTAICETNV
jgi:hypothetical protein